MKDKFALKDSGKREQFQSGAKRDTREGKGRFDLLSPFVLARDAKLMERGAIKYGDRNWEKGMPFSRFIDSALRHILQFTMGLSDEDHLAQARFNLAAIMHFQETDRSELDDMPHYLSGPRRCPVCQGHGYEDGSLLACKACGGTGRIE